MALVFNVITMIECVILQEIVLCFWCDPTFLRKLCVLHVVGSVILKEVMVCA